MNKGIKILILILGVTVCVALVFLLSHAISSPTEVVFKNQYNQVLQGQNLPQQNSSYEQMVGHYERLVDLTNTFHLNNRVSASLVDSVQLNFLEGYVPMVYSRIKETLSRPTNWGTREINRFHSLVRHIDNLPSKNYKGENLIKGEKNVNEFVADIKNAANNYKNASGIAYWTNNHTIESARQTIKESRLYLNHSYIRNCDKASALSSLPQKIAQNLCQQWNNDMSIELQGYAGTYTESQYNELKSKWSKILLDIEALKNEYPVFASGYNNLKTSYNTYTSNAKSYYQSQYSNNTYRYSWN